LTSTPHIPVSWGELIDKITILEIKSVEIADPAARANVGKELGLLREIAAAVETREDVRALKQALKAVNAGLWSIEDRIRDKERNGEFDGGFIDLARSVYKQNDERARIKRRINDILASDLVEEKSYRDY
jgi:hypothetical protein